MESSRQRRNWAIDAVLFVGFMVCMFLDLTGIELHQWLGVSLTLLAGYHLSVHWRWLVTVSRKFLGRLSGEARLKYLVDAGLLVGFLLTGTSGLVISTWFDLRLSNYLVWRDFHVIASVVTLSMVVLKIGLHWRWIMTVAARHLSANTASPTSGRAPQTAPVAATIGRREFLGLMGVVGAAALFAGVNALAGAGVGTAHVRATVKEMDRLSSDSKTRSAAGATSTGGSVPSQKGSTSPTEDTSTSDPCVVECPKRCSYPGRCRRYVDSDRSGRCDLGECAA